MNFITAFIRFQIRRFQKAATNTNLVVVISSNPNLFSTLLTTGKTTKFPILFLYYLQPHLKNVAALSWGIKSLNVLQMQTEMSTEQ